MKKVTSRIIAYFLQGIIVVVPLVALYLVGRYVYDLLAEYQLFGSVWLTLGIIIGGVLLIGYFARNVFFRPLFFLFEDVLTRAPGIKFVYSSIKDLMEAFVGEKKRFNRPVMIDLIAETELQRFGFVTEDELEKLGQDFAGKVAVYIPMSYSVSGNLYIVPAERVIPLPGVDPAELMKYILSGGVTDLEDVLKINKAKKSAKEENG
ncbi:MAG: DUF502 domain-containing protein [Bacteroidota bacterium]